MGFDTLFYEGVRPVAGASVDGDSEPFARIVETVLGMDVIAANGGCEATRADGFRVSATSVRREAHDLFLLAFPRRIVEDTGDRVLMELLMRLSTDWRLTLGRTFLTGELAPRREEWKDEPLTGLDWFQHFGPERARNWPPDTWKTGPFHLVDVQTDGSVGLCLAPDPFKHIPRRAAAEYLGISLRPLYGRSPATGERIIIPWN